MTQSKKIEYIYKKTDCVCDVTYAIIKEENGCEEQYFLTLFSRDEGPIGTFKVEFNEDAQKTWDEMKCHSYNKLCISYMDGTWKSIAHLNVLICMDDIEFIDEDSCILHKIFGIAAHQHG